MTALKHIDLTYLRQITDGDEEIEKELFALFIKSCDRLVQAMELALDKEDEQAWSDHAHELKGVCSNMGAQPMQELCKKAEVHDFKDKSQMQQIVQELRQAYNLAKTEMQAIYS